MMRFKSTVALLLVLSFMLVSFSEIGIVKTEPRMIIVPDDYATIQEAIINVDSGGSVFVKSGSYGGNLVIHRPLSLIGENKDTTIIRSGHTGTNVLINREDNVTVTGFTIRSVEVGIHLLHSNNCNISGNNIIEISHHQGIWLYDSSQNIVAENTVKGGGSGIELELSSENTIVDNTVMENERGIMLIESSDNIVCANIIANSTYGFVLRRNCSGNTFYANSISSCSSGIMIGGTEWHVGTGWYATNMTDTTFHHNNFINNAVPVEDQGCVCGIDCWDDGKEGNYWSNYNGIDNDSDEIGDTPYLVYENYCNGNHTDNYPLMTPANIFVIPEFPVWTSLLVILVTVLAVVVIYRQKLHKQNQRRDDH
jgi:parallel beta-helix repeat protein